MKNSYSQQEILSYLEKESIGILGTRDEKTNSIRLRVMYYGVDNNFAVYLMTTKGSPKTEQIVSSNNVSFIIVKIEDPYDRSWEVEINGEAKFLSNETEINNALIKLKDRNPFADVAIEAGITSSQFELIKLISETVKFSVYGEALKGISPTVLKL